MSYADLLIVYHKHYIITLIVKLKIYQVVKNLVVRKKFFSSTKKLLIQIFHLVSIQKPSLCHVLLTNFLKGFQVRI